MTELSAISHTGVELERHAVTRRSLAVFYLSAAREGNFSAPVREWLNRGIDAWVRSGSKLPLERCLGLPGTAMQLQLALRDLYLRRASSYFLGTTADQARALAKYAAEFQCDLWPAWKNYPGPPERASALACAVYFALKAGQQIPDRKSVV